MSGRWSVDPPDEDRYEQKPVDAADEPTDDRRPCPLCHGTGSVLREDGLDRLCFMGCLECDGTGWVS